MNTATDRGNYGSSTFETNDQVAIIRTNVVLNKTVTDDGAPEPGDQLTYTITSTNSGAAAGPASSERSGPLRHDVPAGSITSVMGAASPAPTASPDSVSGRHDPPARPPR